MSCIPLLPPTFTPHSYNHPTKVYIKCIMMHCFAITGFERILHFSAQLVTVQYQASLHPYDVFLSMVLTFSRGALLNSSVLQYIEPVRQCNAHCTVQLLVVHCKNGSGGLVVLWCSTMV